MKQTVTVGIIGSQRAAHTNAGALSKLYGVDVRLKAVSSLDRNIDEYADKFAIPDRYTDYKALLQDPEIDMVVICTPPQVHIPMALSALEAGKHVVCEKPMTGYFGLPGDDELIGHSVKKRVMYDHVMAEMEDLKTKMAASDLFFMYAENWIYSPAIQKVTEFLRVGGSKILHMNAVETQSGSPSPASALWRRAGGGSLARLGTHPLGAILYLKQLEARVRNEDIRPVSVTADMEFIGGHLRPEERRFMDGEFRDVEDWALASVAFSDGTRGVLTVGDTILGGTKNYLDIHTGDSSFQCNMTPNNHLRAYTVDPKHTEGIRVSEKIETTTGWQDVWIDDDMVRGYRGEFQAFVESVACGREPESNFQIAYETTKVLYGAYVAAEEGIRFNF